MSGGERRVGKRAEQKRRWDRENRHLCVDCGAKCGSHAGPSKAEQRCVSCAAEAKRTTRDAVVPLYNEGLPIREIAERLGVTFGAAQVALIRAREEGLIGYRYNVKGGQRAGR